MTRDEAIDIRTRSLCGKPVDINELEEAMRIIATPEGRRELPVGVTTNPWLLTPGMCETLTVMVRTCDEQEAAEQLGVRRPAVSMAISRAAQRMKAPNRLATLLAWDRFLRSEAAA
jgi:DNA-binding NarL/FixJ family response regulator